MSNKEQNLVSRRSFLKKSALIAGVAATGTLAACAPSAQNVSDQTADTSWDKEVDVLVVGSGTVAMAAIAAKDAGAESVLIIEKGPAFGGTTAVSGGGMWIPANYVAAEQGIEDNREDAYKYMQTVTDGQSTDELINAYLDNANKMIEWLRDSHGYTFSLGGTAYNDYYEVDGFRPFGRTVYFMEEGKATNGPVAWGQVRATCEEAGVEILLNTAGKRLVTDASGAVIGVIAEGKDGEMAIKANKGVILGTGGFDWNKEMDNAYLRGPIFYSNAVNTNTGDGHLMAMAIGADLRNMNSCWGVPAFLVDPDNMKGEADWQMYRGKPGAIVVNKHGERIGNEAGAYHTFNRSFWVWDSGTFEWRNTPAYFICDSTFTERYFLPGSGYQVGVIPEWMKTSDTLEGLCQELGIDVDGFNAMIAAFNENAANGVDPVWHRGEYQFDLGTAGDPTRTDLKNICLAPVEKGPFYGFAYGPGTCGTNGGLRVNGNGQVLNVWGEPIPGLYAVGNTAGSVMGAAYPGGGSTVGAGAVFGMIAGRHAAGGTTEG